MGRSFPGMLERLGVVALIDEVVGARCAMRARGEVVEARLGGLRKLDSALRGGISPR